MNGSCGCRLWRLPVSSKRVYLQRCRSEVVRNVFCGEGTAREWAIPYRHDGGSREELVMVVGLVTDVVVKVVKT